nr:hypothetical protein B0A51_13304 [Rachicladosporium sp. CCFEE 5018]
MSEGPQYGPNKALSHDPPDERDLKLNELLLAELKSQKNFESAEDGKKRADVLRKLHALTKQLVQVVGKAKKLPAAILDEAGGRVFTYGSYSLGVYGPGSDIDTLVVAPKHVSRDDFFQYFPDLLRKAVPAEEITELVAVQDASVPIIKIELSGISIDLIFCSLQVASVPPTLSLKSNDLLRGLNETDLRCINGTRVTDKILDSVPQSKPFRLALRAIKLWAQRRAIYGNVVGFPGGVAYAMMVAKICQLYPKAAAPKIVGRFFWLMAQWHWPQPLRLAAREDAPLQLREWDPETSFHDRKHLMPIITPAYPSMNSTHNIGPSTFQVIKKELRRGQQITDAICGAGPQTWKDLFQKHTFFTEDYKHYLSVVSASSSKSAQQAWSGLCLARLRRLIIGIEELQGSVELAHPFNKGFDRVHEYTTDEEKNKILQGNLDYQVKETQTTDIAADMTAKADADVSFKDAAASTAEGTPAATNDSGDGTNGAATPETTDAGKQRIYTTTYYVGIGLKPDAKSLDISYAIQAYKNIVTSSDLHDQSVHSIRVIHARNYDLPADVFAEGELRPTRVKKQKPAAKRTVSAAGLDSKQETANGAKRPRSSNGATTNGTAPVVKGVAT